MLRQLWQGKEKTISVSPQFAAAGKDRIEQLLALGATRWEAVQASLQRCVRVALTPILNQMNVVGIVSIPGEFPPSLQQAYASSALCLGDAWQHTLKSAHYHDGWQLGSRHLARDANSGLHAHKGLVQHLYEAAQAESFLAWAGMMTGQILSGSDPSQASSKP